MDLMPTPEQDAIRESVRAFLDAELPMSRVRALCGAAGDAYAQDTQSLRTYINQLRGKLSDDAAAPRFIRTEPGIGYRLVESES